MSSSSFVVVLVVSGGVVRRSSFVVRSGLRRDFISSPARCLPFAPSRFPPISVAIFFVSCRNFSLFPVAIPSFSRLDGPLFFFAMFPFFPVAIPVFSPSLPRRDVSLFPVAMSPFSPSRCPPHLRRDFLVFPSRQMSKHFLVFPPRSVMMMMMMMHDDDVRPSV